jgi:hypothetical protein
MERLEFFDAEFNVDSDPRALRSRKCAEIRNVNKKKSNLALDACQVQQCRRQSHVLMIERNRRSLPTNDDLIAAPTTHGDIRQNHSSVANCLMMMA